MHLRDIVIAYNYGPFIYYVTRYKERRVGWVEKGKSEKISSVTRSESVARAKSILHVAKNSVPRPNPKKKK